MLKHSFGDGPLVHSDKIASPNPIGYIPWTQIESHTRLICQLLLSANKSSVLGVKSRAGPEKPGLGLCGVGPGHTALGAGLRYRVRAKRRART
jgi:hypothetical protein